MDIPLIVSVTSVCFSIVAIMVSYRTHKDSLKANCRPVLVFSLRSENLWQLQNVGNGPALGIIVGESLDGRNWTSITKCYPLASGGHTMLPWLTRSMELGAIYKDVYNNHYTVHCADSENTVKPGIRFRKWKPTNQEWLETLICKGENLINPTDLEGCSSFDLDVKRNEIYARHGYIFSRPDLATHFEKQHWYKGVTSDKWLIESQLSVDEKAIARFIWRYQVKHNLTSSSIAHSDVDTPTAKLINVCR